MTRYCASFSTLRDTSVLAPSHSPESLRACFQITSLVNVPKGLLNDLFTQPAAHHNHMWPAVLDSYIRAINPVAASRQSRRRKEVTPTRCLIVELDYDLDCY